MWDIFIWSFSISHSWEPLSTAPCIAHPQWLQECQQSPKGQMIQCHDSPQVCCTVFYCVDLSLHFLQTDWAQIGSHGWASPATCQALQEVIFHVVLRCQCRSLHPLLPEPGVPGDVHSRFLPELGISSTIPLPFHTRLTHMQHPFLIIFALLPLRSLLK